jgi:4-alpha-glucanotransferase
MADYDELINELSGLCGIYRDYWDIFGNKHEASFESKTAVLRAMGCGIDSEEDVLTEIKKRRDFPWNSFVEPVIFASVNSDMISIAVYIPLPQNSADDAVFSMNITDEHGHKDSFNFNLSNMSPKDERLLDGMSYAKYELPYAAQDGKYRIGYYAAEVLFSAVGSSLRGSCRLIITPDSCYIPPELENARTWGLSVNLYCLCSERNWGLGDFTDLKNLISLSGDLGAGFVGINPLHAIPNTAPFGISPYSAVSRLYRNFLYIDIESVPEVKNSDKAQSLLHSEDFIKEIKRLRETEFIDYEAVASLKEEMLKTAFNDFYKKLNIAQKERHQAFLAYVKEQGNLLLNFAVYMAMSRHFKNRDWMVWPEDYRKPENSAVKQFAVENRKDVMFYQYIQWIIDTQMYEAAQKAKKIRMPVGIYHDLAIGSISDGSDAWMCQRVIAKDIDVGAPPDDFNPNGQNWGFPPFIPEACRDMGYDYFIHTIRNAMRHCGAVRIDHALGLFRLFWIPKGMHASKGVYLNYPYEHLLGIIALESWRNKTMVIAEDLGTVGDNVKEVLQNCRMLSYKLLYFERRYPDPAFKTPDEYAETALCAVTTHDLPTLYGWWSGHDIEVKKNLGIYQNETAYESDVLSRRRDKRLLMQALKMQGLISDLPVASLENDDEFGFEMTEDICLAVYAYLAKTRCKLIAVSLDDISGALDQQNMPGITDGYPSWMRKAAITLEDLKKSGRMRRLSEIFSR